MYPNEFDLNACIGCGGTMKCGYCGGTGQRRGIFFKKMKTCNKCQGSGACPFCIGGKTSWALERMRNWIPEDMLEKQSRIKRREFELRDEYKRLINLGIQVVSFEEFHDNKESKNRMHREVHGRIRPKNMIVSVILVYEQMVNEYETYLRQAERDYRYGDW
jgi:hypothetical protein